VTPAQNLARYAEKPERLVVGLMSGTSVDAIDAAVVKISGSGRATRAELLSYFSYPWTADLRQRILSVSHGEGNAEEVSRLNFEIAEVFASAAQSVAGSREIDAVASHGQTVSHTAPHATLQLGSSAVLAARLGVPVVSDFRSADVALGGQGAPLVPYADWCLLTDQTKSRAVQNLGGIGNVTFLPANARSEQVIGFDTGPGNMLLDLAASWSTDGAKNFDEGGSLASQGQVDFDLLEYLYRHPFLAKPPPKSAGREEFGRTYFQSVLDRMNPTGESSAVIFLGYERFEIPTMAISPENLLATLGDFTALSIADAYHRFLPKIPDEVILCGGGVRNPVLVARIRDRLPSSKVVLAESVGIDSDAKEAMAFAILANETLLGNPSNLPSVTGARGSAILGNIAFPLLPARRGV
jgi:anhydro-N-acetylmuramic acid kinase